MLGDTLGQDGVVGYLATVRVGVHPMGVPFREMVLMSVCGLLTVIAVVSINFIYNGIGMVI